MKKRTLAIAAVVLLVIHSPAEAQGTLGNPPGYDPSDETPSRSVPDSPGAGFLADMVPEGGIEMPAPAVAITYWEEARRPPVEGSPNLYGRRQRTVSLPLDADLESIDLPDDGKRAAVLMLTARRHSGLLDKMKKAETVEEKEEAESALKENYKAHYAIETWWRQQKLKKLEEELATLKAQVQKRVDSEEKYVEAAMTIAQLHVDGMSITPPVPAAPGSTSAIEGTVVGGPYYSEQARGNYPNSGPVPLGQPPTTRYAAPELAFPPPSLPMNHMNPADKKPTLVRPESN